MHANLFAIRKKDAVATESTEFHRTVDIRNVANLKAYLPMPMAEDFRLAILYIFSISNNQCLSRVDERNKRLVIEFSDIQGCFLHLN
jgi:hypothetical protein